LKRTGPVANAAKRNRRSQRNRIEESALGVLDPDCNLCPLGWCEAEFQEAVAVLGRAARASHEPNRGNPKSKQAKAHNKSSLAVAVLGLKEAA
jgi:hypothetical protein